MRLFKITENLRLEILPTCNGRRVIEVGPTTKVVEQVPVTLYREVFPTFIDDTLPTGPIVEPLYDEWKPSEHYKPCTIEYEPKLYTLEEIKEFGIKTYEPVETFKEQITLIDSYQAITSAGCDLADLSYQIVLIFSF